MSFCSTLCLNWIDRWIEMIQDNDSSTSTKATISTISSIGFNHWTWVNGIATQEIVSLYVNVTTCTSIEWNWSCSLVPICCDLGSWSLQNDGISIDDYSTSTISQWIVCYSCATYLSTDDLGIRWRHTFESTIYQTVIGCVAMTSPQLYIHQRVHNLQTKDAPWVVDVPRV